MKPKGRPIAPLALSQTEREVLERYSRRARANRHLAFRARLVLACAEGKTGIEVARRYRTSSQTVSKWRRRFVGRRLEGLHDEPRVGAPRKISDADVEAVVVKTLETTPRARTHWSTRKMAAKMGMSHTTVSRVWKTFGLKPHRTRGFKLSPDPQLIDKVRDIVGLYLNPPQKAAVFAVDEKSQIQALQRAQPILPMDLGQPERRTHNYLRHGTLDLFAALDVVTGKVIARCKKQHRSADFIAFLRDIDQHTPKGLDIHLVLDNLSAHKSPTVQRFFTRHPRFVPHFTPSYASWLNLVERFFGLLTQEALKRASHVSIPELQRAIEAYVEAHNAEAKPFVWRKSADEILASIRRFGQRTQQAHGDA